MKETEIKGRGFPQLLKVNEAIKRIEKEIKYKINEFERTHIDRVIGRINYEDIRSPIDVPPFDRAAMDGYAIKAEEIIGASINNPITLKIIDEIKPGETPKKEVKKGTAIEISTGAPIPPGANAVIPYENVKRTNRQIEVYSTIPPGKNVSRKGEDLKRNQIIIERRTIIRPWNIAALASANITELKVLRKPRIAIISTGAELIEPGETPTPGKVINSTKIMLGELIKENGGEPIEYGNLEDDTDKISKNILKASKENDIVITTGGTSIGKSDYTIEAALKIGANLIFHGVAIRPGKPVALAKLKEKPIIMLSGYPVAALMEFEIFVKKIIHKICDTKEMPPLKIKAKIKRRTPSQLGVRDFLRVILKRTKKGIIAEPLRLTGSGILSTITRATGIIEIPEEVEGLEKGEIVDVIILKPF